MLVTILSRLYQIKELYQGNNLRSILGELIFYNRKAIVFEKDLSVHLANPGPFIDGYKVVDITLDTFNKYKKSYILKHRYLKAITNLRKGYNGFAILKDDKIIGDLWYYFQKGTKHIQVHPDIKWLHLLFSSSDVYLFDILVLPEQRIKNLSGKFYNYILLKLKEKEFEKALSFVWADNLPPIWMHRMTKWNEVFRVQVHRFGPLRHTRKL